MHEFGEAGNITGRRLCRNNGLRGFAPVVDGLSSAQYLLWEISCYQVRVFADLSNVFRIPSK